MSTGARITPGQPWLDTSGKRIHAHGGSIIVVDGVFYWYGENKEHSSPGSGVWHWGVRCYSSVDLMTWEDRGLIIPPSDDPTSPLHPSQALDRPHIVFNAKTGKYVCWVKVMTPGVGQRSTVLTADTLLGPYTIVRSWMRPLNMNAGDFDLVVDPVDGRGYYYFERVHSEMICADLADDYTAVTGQYSTHFPHPHPPAVREAPAHFTRNGLHYLVTSGTTGYYPNPSEVAVAPTYHGPFTVLGDMHPEDESRSSFQSQISSVFRHPGKRDLYIALADRWLPHYREHGAIAQRAFAAHFGAGGPGGPIEELTVTDTSKADYVWLPLTFDGERPSIAWRDSWSPDEYEDA
ncbi:family 43 glycosylhydrolase [Microbacterium xanthum]|uniref:family 43 glycosylhydrolase n=1 Tax=Microbacterium xanthum TaxID=3079794 RepID=UPI002AD55FC0|nr:family 43 glycosylhydrolase [Microbacterium sp. KSW-48]MDZ8171207.1 family 43 glycosylhydrolase [Microbacterium sp. KSW-48]